MSKVKRGDVDRWTTDGLGLVLINKNQNQSKKKETVKKPSAKKRSK